MILNSRSLTVFQLKMLNQEVNHWFIHFFPGYFMHTYFSNEDKHHVAVKSALFSCFVLCGSHPGTLASYKVIILLLSIAVAFRYPFPVHDGENLEEESFNEKCKEIAVCFGHVAVDVIVHVELGDELAKAFVIAIFYFTLGLSWEVFDQNRYLKPVTAIAHIIWVGCFNLLSYYHA